MDKAAQMIQSEQWLCNLSIIVFVYIFKISFFIKYIF